MKCKTITLMLALVVAGYIVSAQGTRVSPGTSLRIESGTFLDIGSGDLTIESDATGDASLLDYGSATFSGAGTTHVQRYLTEGKWHLISSPVNNALSGMFLNDYLQRHNEPNNAWYFIAPVDVPLNVMQGYSLWSIEPAATTEVFSGSTNKGFHNRNFTKTGAGWNLMGNPYPSGIDWDEVSIPAELNGAIWLWDPTIGSSGDYRYYITGGGAGNTTSRFIPSGQGFFVKAETGPGTLSFDNDVRTHSTQDFYKSDPDESMLVLTAEASGISSKTAIRFNVNSTVKVDRLYDVYKIFSDSPDIPMLYTMSESTHLAINTLPSIEGNEVVPAWFRAGQDGFYSIKASDFESIDPSVPVYLYDVEHCALTNLRQDHEYSFDYATGSDKSFLVLFTDPTGMNTAQGGINIYAEGNKVHVNLPVTYLTHNDISAHIYIFDLNGRCVSETSSNTISTTVSFTGNSNLYLVKVITGSETANAKVFINTKN